MPHAVLHDKDSLTGRTPMITTRHNATPPGSWPQVSQPTDEHLPVPGSLVDLLLNEQNNLSAADSFARWHDHAETDGGEGYRSLMPLSMPATGEQYAFEVDLDKCSGCKACVTACHSLNGLQEDETWRKVGQVTSVGVGLPILHHVTTACHHCVEPACLAGCPVRAYEKDPTTGIVRHLDDQCFGCKYCIMMCPYEVPQYRASLGIVRKCDMCWQRLAQGDPPACVQACPNQAIRISIVNQSSMQLEASAESAHLVPTAPHSSLTVPSSRYHIASLERGDGQLRSMDQLHATLQPGHEPLVAMLVLTQASVGFAWTWTMLSQIVQLSRSVALSGWAIILALAVVGVHLALLHLGRPWLAYRAVLGWKTSWLSREIIAFSLYLSAASVTLLTAVWNETGQPLLIIALGQCVLGAVALICSGMVYIATGRRLWNAGRTAIEFGATAASLGTALMAIVCAIPTDFDAALAGSSAMNLGTIELAAVMVAVLAIGPKWIDWRRHLAATNRTPLPLILGATVPDDSLLSGGLLHTLAGRPWRLAWLLWLTMLVWCVIVSIYPMTQALGGLSQAIAVACGLLIFHLIARWLVFASVVFPRMPGAST